MSRKYDQNTMQLMSMFEQMTGSKLRDCFNVDDLQVFVVEKGQIGRAVGRAGANVKKLAQALKSKIKIIEHSEDLGQFVSNTVHPIKPARVEVDAENKIATIVPPDLLSRGLLIGRQAIKLRETEKIVQRFFDLVELKVGRPEEGPQTVEEAEALQGAPKQTVEPTTIGDVAGASVASTTAEDAGESAATPAAPEAPMKTDNDPVEKSPKAAKPRATSVDALAVDVVDEAPTGAGEKVAADEALATTETAEDEAVRAGAEVEGAAIDAAVDEDAAVEEQPEASKKEPKTE